MDTNTMKGRQWLSHPMRPRERVLAALDGQPIDRPAAICPTSIATEALMDQVGAPFPQAHREAELMTQLAETAYTHAGFDSIMPVFSVVQESAALGCDVEWADKTNGPTCTGSLVRCADENKTQRTRLADWSAQHVEHWGSRLSVVELRRRQLEMSRCML